MRVYLLRDLTNNDVTIWESNKDAAEFALKLEREGHKVHIRSMTVIPAKVAE